MGTLHLVATPIGNLEDATIRAIKTLLTVDYILCEDTRHTGQLLKIYELRIKNLELRIKGLEIKNPQLISFYDEVEEKKIPEIIEILQQNKSVALVSDAGTPLISDPGYKLVRECLKRGIKVNSIPGPSSIIAALTLSGLPTNQFLFLGYLPAKGAKRKKILLDIQQLLEKSKQIQPTIIMLETPHRLRNVLVDILTILGDVNIVIARELTKINEEVWRGQVKEAVNNFAQPKGEIILLLSI